MKTTMCSACNGTGQVYVQDERDPNAPPETQRCNDCAGTGAVEVEDDGGVLYAIAATASGRCE